MLSLRDLNRTTLRRQLLLERAAITAGEAVRHLVALQAQLARPPYLGLWTRVQGFERDDLAREIEQRRVVKATFLRGTLHLVATSDYLAFRPEIQPVLTSALEDVVKQKGAKVNVPRMVEAAREFLLERPHTFEEITAHLIKLEPGGDPGAMRYAVRTHLPLVQVPTTTRWSYPGKPEFALAEQWLGLEIPADPDGAALEELVRRYLAAFGPATAADMQTWSYLTDLQPVFERLRPELRVLKDERGRELYDLAEAEPVSEDADVPIRFLPEFDNLLLAHQDRGRFVPKAYRSRVYLPGLRVAATVLIDGFVGGTWTSERTRGVATLRVTLFERVDAGTAAAIEGQSEEVIRFVEPDAANFEVRVSIAEP